MQERTVTRRGATSRTRTDDLRFTKPLLYQLSYRGLGNVLVPTPSGFTLAQGLGGPFGPWGRSRLPDCAERSAQNRHSGAAVLGLGNRRSQPPYSRVRIRAAVPLDTLTGYADTRPRGHPPPVGLLVQSLSCTKSVRWVDCSAGCDSQISLLNSRKRIPRRNEPLGILGSSGQSTTACPTVRSWNLEASSRIAATPASTAPVPPEEPPLLPTNMTWSVRVAS